MLPRGSPTPTGTFPPTPGGWCVAGRRGLAYRQRRAAWESAFPRRRSRLGPDEARAALLELLDVPRALFEGDGVLTVVCFDEFQDLLVADDALDGLMRSVIQHHVESATYVFAGSQPSLMRALFADYERPFYGQARPMPLPPLPPAEAAADIEGLLLRDGLDPASAVDELLAFSGGHPQRTILLAHHLYELLDEGTAEDPASDAVAATVETADALHAVWDGLDRNERVVLLALRGRAGPRGEHRLRASIASPARASATPSCAS